MTQESRASGVRPARELHVGLFVGSSSLDIGPHFFVDFVLERFRGLGHSVSIIAPGVTLPPTLDAGILHVAATRVPIEMASRLPRDLPIVNRHVHDISKRRVSRMLVTANDREAGPVIVKSNANFAGRNDFARLRRWQRWGRRLARFLRPGAGPAEALPYRIYESVTDVPRGVWSDPDLVVERFIPEREGSLYCLRKWVFLGAAEMQVISRSENPIVKAGSSSSTFVRDSAPQELRAERRRLGFDYGKFDYVMHDGRPVLLDANSTPGFGSRSPQLEACADELAVGLEEWVCAQLARASEAKGAE